MKTKIALLVFFLSYGNVWYGHDKLDLWHESDLEVAKGFGIGTEFIYDLQNRPEKVGYGYMFAYYRLSPSLRLAVGSDYEGNAVSQVSYSYKLGR